MFFIYTNSENSTLPFSYFLISNQALCVDIKPGRPVGATIHELSLKKVIFICFCQFVPQLLGIRLMKRTVLPKTYFTYCFIRLERRTFWQIGRTPKSHQRNKHTEFFFRAEIESQPLCRLTCPACDALSCHRFVYSLMSFVLRPQFVSHAGNLNACDSEARTDQCKQSPTQLESNKPPAFWKTQTHIAGLIVSWHKWEGVSNLHLTVNKQFG